MQNTFMRSDRRTIQNGQTSASFTPTEWTIIKRLNQTPGKPVSSQKLMLAVTSYEASQTEAIAYMATIANRIRKKLETIGMSRWLQNQRGAGYLAESAIAEMEPKPTGSVKLKMEKGRGIEA